MINEKSTQNFINIKCDEFEIPSAPRLLICINLQSKMMVKAFAIMQLWFPIYHLHCLVDVFIYFIIVILKLMDSSNRYSDLIKLKVLNDKDYSKSWEYIRQKGLILRVVTDSDIEKMLNLVDIIFTNDEPISKNLKLQPGEWASLTSQIIKYPMLPNNRDLNKDALSIGIFDESNDVVAFSLSNDVTTKYKFTLEISKEMNRLLQLLTNLSEPYKGGRQFKRGEVFYCFLLGCATEHRGYGLSTLILAEQAIMACKLGYSEYYLEATNHLTYLSMKSVFQNTKVTHSIDKTFEDELGKPIENLDGQILGVMAKLKP